MLPAELSNNPNAETLHSLINQLCTQANPEHISFIEHTLENILKIQKGNPNKNDLRLIQTALDELVQSFLMFKDYRDIRKVSIFGSARTKPSHPNYILAKNTAKKLAEANFLVITGAGPGIMEAGNEGAGKKSFGLHILLPFEQNPNKYVPKENMIPYRYFFTRKLTFVKESDAIVLFPGGFGTQDEGFEVLTLMQTGRCSPRPFIVINYNKSTYWEHWKKYVKTELSDRQYICPEDIDLIKEFSSPEEITNEIAHFYSTYHSIKYHNGTAYMRVNTAPSHELLSQLNTMFKHLLTSGTFETHSHTHTPEEKNLYPEKPRLVFSFNHKSYGGLVKLIHFINSFTKQKKGD